MLLHQYPRLLTLLAAVSAAGCTGDQGLSSWSRVDASATPENGVILVGLRVLQEPTRHSWLLGEVTYHPVYQVGFRELRSDGTLGRLGRQVNICDSGRVFFNGALSDCDPTRLQYRLISVPAGQYTLTGISAKMDRTNVQTSFVKPPSDSRSSIFEFTGYGDHVRNPNESFAVAPGEIVYVGDLSFSWRPHALNAALAFSRDDAAARGTLQAYPKVQGRFVYRPVSGPQ